MKHCATLLFASVAYGAVVGRQLPAVPPKGNGPIGEVVGGALSAAGGATSAAGSSLNGLGPVTDIPKGVLEGVGSGLSSAGQSAKGTPKRARRQAVGDLGGIIGGALVSAGTAVQQSGKEYGDSTLSGGLLNQIGAGLTSAGQSTAGLTGNPRLILKQQLEKRQDPSTLGAVANGALEAAGGIISTVGAGLESAKGQNDEVANAGSIVSSVGSTLSGMGGAKGPKSVRRRQLLPGSLPKQAPPAPPQPKSAGPIQPVDPPLPRKAPGRARRQLPALPAKEGLPPKGVLPPLPPLPALPALGPKSGTPPPPPPPVRRQLPALPAKEGLPPKGVLPPLPPLPALPALGPKTGAPPLAPPAPGAVGTAVGGALEAAGQAVESLAGKGPRVSRRQAKDAAGQVTGGALQAAGGITGTVADGLRAGGSVTQPAADAVGGVASGLNNAGASAKGSAPKMHRRQAKDAAGQVAGGALQGAGGVTGAVADGLKSGGPVTQPAANAVGGVSSGLNNAGAGAKGGAPKRYRSRRQTPPKGAGGVGGAVADTAAGALQAASGVTGAVADGLKSGGAITAPAGDAVNGVAQGLSGAANSAKGYGS